MRPDAVAKSERAISSRAREFFRRTKTYAPGLNEVLASIRPLGEVVVFGGLLRNAALFGLSQFRSDIDLVVSSPDEPALRDALDILRPARTAFGGYRFRVDSFQVDVWPLDGTWAFREGLVKEVSIPNLVKTTFFNWDAIAFSLDSGRLFHRESYIEDIAARMLDVVLWRNPNPLGMAARAMRLLQSTSGHLSPSLVRFLLEVTGTLNESSHKSSQRIYTESWEYRMLRTLFPILREHQTVTPHSVLSLAWQMGIWEK